MVLVVVASLNEVRTITVTQIAGLAIASLIDLHGLETEVIYGSRPRLATVVLYGLHGSQVFSCREVFEVYGLLVNGLAGMGIRDSGEVMAKVSLPIDGAIDAPYASYYAGLPRISLGMAKTHEEVPARTFAITEVLLHNHSSTLSVIATKADVLRTVIRGLEAANALRTSTVRVPDVRASQEHGKRPKGAVAPVPLLVGVIFGTAALEIFVLYTQAYAVFVVHAAVISDASVEEVADAAYAVRLRRRVAFVVENFRVAVSITPTITVGAARIATTRDVLTVTILPAPFLVVRFTSVVEVSRKLSLVSTLFWKLDLISYTCPLVITRYVLRSS